MIKRIKKVVVSVMAVGMLLGGVMPVQANIDHTSRLEWSRNSSTHLVQATPHGRRTGTTRLTSIRLRIRSNAVTVVNGVATNNVTEHPWSTHDDPRHGIEYPGIRRSRTIRQGFVESHVAIRPLNSVNFIGEQRLRQSFN